MRALLAFGLLLLAILGATTTALAQEYQLDVLVKTRTADGTEPLKDVDIVLSGPEGTTGPGSIAGYHMTTGSDGKASVKLKLPGKYKLVANHPDYEQATTTATLDNPKFPQSISWTLRRKGVVTQYKLVVNVHTDTGSPVEGAEIHVTGPASKDGRTGENGTTDITLPMRGEYEIVVSHKNFGEVKRTVTFTETGQTKTEDFFFRPVSSGMRIEVTVIDQDGDPVPDANVQFGSVGSRSTTTDFRGRASILITNREREVPNILNQLIIDARDIRSKTDPIELKVTKKDFQDGSATVTPVTGGLDRQYPVTVQLQRKLGSGIKIHVLVFEKGSHQALMDAKVVMAPTEFKTTQRFSGSTDGEGRAVLTAYKTGSYTITISRTGYTTVNDTVTIDRFEKQELPYELEAKAGPAGKMRRMLRLKVRAKNSAGKTVAVKGAAVTLSTGQSGATDQEGNMCILHTEAPGESLTVTVTPKSGSGYKPKSDTVIVQANGTLFDEEKIQNAQFKELLRQERLKRQKENPRDLSLDDNLDRIWEGLGNSWGKEFTADIAAEIERAFGPQAVDNCVIMLDSSAASIDGDVIPKKGAVRIGENNRVEVALLYHEDEGDNLQVHEKVELFGPGGKLITSNVANRSLKPSEYSRRYFDIVCSEPGTYQVKSTVSGPNGLSWVDKASFVVQKGAAAPTSPPMGVFKLTNKVIGTVTGTGKGPYGNWTCSKSEGSFSAQYETTTEYDNHATFTANWSIPPAILKPGDVLELTYTCSGRCWGRDKAYVGLDVGWDHRGNATVIERVKAFCGLASDGKDYPSAAGKVKLKIGSGGELKLWANYNGVWGGDNYSPICEYTYIYEAPEPVKPGQKKKTTMTASGG